MASVSLVRRAAVLATRAGRNDGQDWAWHRPPEYFLQDIPSATAVELSRHYSSPMNWLEAAGWGVVGGLVAQLVSLSAAIVAAGYGFPWRGVEGGPWPRVIVGVIALVVGGVLALALHTQISGAWAAIVVGVQAPGTIRGIVSGVEVSERPTRQRSGRQS